MTPASRLSRLPLAWKLSLGAITVLLLVLCTAVSWVTLRIWHDAESSGRKALVDAAGSAAKLLDVYDEASRKAALKDMAYLKGQLHGEFTLVPAPAGAAGPQLQLGAQPLNGDVSRVDRFTESTGAVATVFMRQGDDFVRVATSLKKADGTRATGTQLDHAHPAYAMALKGAAFTGRAQLFGKTYATRYEAIRRGDEVIGLLFVGTDLSDLMAGLRETMRALRPFDEATMLAVDVSSGESRGHLFGLDKPGRIAVQDSQASAWLQSVAGTAGGLASSWSAATQAASEAELMVGHARSESWQWAVVCEVPRSVVMAAARDNLTALWLTMLGAVIALQGLIIALTRRLVGLPLNRIVATLEKLAEGDLSEPVQLDRHDELGRLAQAMEAFRRHLVGTLHTVRGSAESVAHASVEIAHGNFDLSQRTEVQASALQETSATMEQLSTTVSRNADNSQVASQLAVQASGVARQGGQVIGDVVQTMQQIHASARRIGDIVSVIDGIAFQTNILALNAAVEAARAGEQGRGFAVVAGEVRTLAQRAAASAREIKALIHSSGEQVEHGAQLVDQARSTMDEIVGSIGRVAEVVNEISRASVEQNTGVSQVAQSVTQMDQVTQQNSALVEQSAAAAESLKDQSQQLLSAVSAFRLSA